MYWFALWPKKPTNKTLETRMYEMNDGFQMDKKDHVKIASTYDVSQKMS